MIIVQRFGRPQSIRLDQHLPDIVVIWLLWQQISCSGENGKSLLYHEVKNNNVNKKPPKNFKILLYTVVAERVRYFVLLNYSYKSWSIIKPGTVLKSACPEDSKNVPES